MNKRVVMAPLLAVLLAAAGCNDLGALADLLAANRVTVDLVNNAASPVDLTLIIGDEQLLPGFLGELLGEELDFVLQPGETSSFSRDCDDLQTIFIEDADLLVLGSLGPEANTDVLRDGDDFSCGDRIVFTFAHSAVVLDFDVTVSIR